MRCDAITVDYEPLPAVTDAEAALKPRVRRNSTTPCPDNLVLHGDAATRTPPTPAIADAEVVVRQRFVNQRMMANTVEARGSLARLRRRRTGDYTLWTNIQPTYPVRLLISLYVLGHPVQQAAGDRARRPVAARGRRATCTPTRR